MKKFIAKLILVFFLFVFPSVSASTVMETKQSTNGIDFNFTFTEGYVGGIHVVMELDGNVDFDSIVWHSSLPESYTKRYTYNNHKITLYITTGDASKNLLNKNRVLEVGTLKVKNTSSQSRNYSVKLESITIVDANYKSLEIEGKTVDNQYVISGTENKPSKDPSPPSTDEELPVPGTSTNPNRNPSTPSLGDEELSNSRPNQSENKDELHEKDDSLDENNSNVKEDDNLNEDKKDDEEQNIKDDEKQEETSKMEKNKPNYFLIGLGVVSVFCFIVFVVYVGKSNKY